MILTINTIIGSEKLGVKLILSDIKPEEVRVENNLVVYRNRNIWVVLQDTLHRDLAKELVDKVKEVILSGQREINVDPLYEEVDKANTKQYLLKRGCSVDIEGKIYTKAIYKSGEGYFYKNMETKEWVKVDHLEGDSYIKR